MSDTPPATPAEPSPTSIPSSQPNAEDSRPPSEFRWQAFFQRTSEPVFLLNRQRRILFVNRAWEELTGIKALEARGLTCTRRQTGDPDSWSALARALDPPREVFEGQTAAIRRMISRPNGRHWWDIHFFPLRDSHGLLLVLGKIKPLSTETTVASMTLPEKVVARRRRVADRFRLDQWEGASLALRRVADQARLAGQTRAPVLIIGAPGTGKRHLARTIHHQRPEGNKSFAALQCAGLPEQALAAALFGDLGLLRRPGLGTLYLAEPAGLPRDLQARLTDFLAEPSEDSPRLIAGCCTPPGEEVKAGRLSNELCCALGTLVISLPCLRDRIGELPELTTRVLEQLQANSENLPPSLTPAAMEILQAYSWPGNWRELRQVLATALSHCKENRIDVADLPSYLRLAVKMEQASPAEPDRTLPLDSLLEQAERRLIQHALKLADGNKSKAAEILSIWRPRLLRRMEALGIQNLES